MRKRFSLNAVANSDGIHIRIKHDHRANTTGRTNYMFCGKAVIITDGSVFSKESGQWLGHLYIDDYGDKYVYGPHNKGLIKNK